MLEGSSPTFKWTVDDKPYFTYYNTVLNVIYQHAAIYKLTVKHVACVLFISIHEKFVVFSLKMYQQMDPHFIGV